MLKFDKLKIISSAAYISDIDTNIFLTQSKGDAVLYYKYHQDSPFSLTIQADFNKDELTIEFTGKILLDDYPQLINHTNIRKCLSRINDLGICHIDVGEILTHSEVGKCDVTCDICVPQNEVFSLRQRVSNYDKWNCSKYDGEGIALSKKVKTPRYKERLCIYDKKRELETAANREFLSAISDKRSLLDYFEDKTRFELNINTKQQIRKLLNIQDNQLSHVLHSEANPILSVYDEAINQSCVSLKQTDMKDYMRGLVLKDCDYDLAKVEAKIRGLTPKTTSIRRAMRPFRDLYEKVREGNEQDNIRTQLLCQ